jgi:hypothetical protein
MSENIELNKKVYSKAAYDQIIDTDFNQLGIKPIQTQIDTQPTLNEFFDLYNELFYTIPELGEIDSHEYLITKSSEYINFSANQDEIIALQNEIFQLRTELLEAQVINSGGLIESIQTNSSIRKWWKQWWKQWWWRKLLI